MRHWLVYMLRMIDYKMIGWRWRDHPPPRPIPREIERLEDALLGYFGGGYPVGTCPDREEAIRRLLNVTLRAKERHDRGEAKR